MGLMLKQGCEAGVQNFEGEDERIQQEGGKVLWQHVRQTDQGFRCKHQFSKVGNVFILALFHSRD